MPPLLFIRFGLNTKLR